MGCEPQIMRRDINNDFQEFMEAIVINYKVPLVVDPWTLAPVKQSISQVQLPVSWHDVIQQMLSPDNSGQSILGILLPGDAYCIYQGNLNILNFHLPQNIVTRKGIDYIIENVINPSDNRWIFYLRRKR